MKFLLLLIPLAGAVYGGRCFYKLFFRHTAMKKPLMYALSFLSFAGVLGLTLVYGDITLGFMLHLYIVFAIFDLIGLIKIIPYVKTKLSQYEKFCRYAGTAAAVGIALIMTVYGYFNAVTTDISRYTLSFDKKYEPTRIMYVSDVHIDSQKRERVFEDIRNAALEYEPEFIVFGGDLTDSSSSEDDLLFAAEKMGELSQSAEVLFVFGNHDIWLGAIKPDYIRSALSENNVRVLEDEIYETGDIRFIGRKEIAGTAADSGRKPIEELDTDEHKINIVLDHRPMELTKLSQAGVDLSLSGHTHNGQIFPAGIICSVFGINELEYGTRKIGSMTALVSSGVSTWGMNVRTQGDSEIVVVDIVQN